LPKEKLKGQLQKIANSRTGGTKTDEALGKTGAGPEGLPHSIIVTEEGVEGEVDLADQVQTDAAASTQPAEPDRGGGEPPMAAETKTKGKQPVGVQKKETKPSKGKAAQMALFSGSDRQERPDRPDRRDRPVSASKPRGKK